MGFFQIVNHGVPLAVMEEMLQGICRFHEQPAEDKMELYSRDFKNPVNFYCSGDLKVRTKSAVDWRDTLFCREVDDEWDFEALPQVCSKYDHLAHLGYLKSFSCHAMPLLYIQFACPELDLTLGTIKHSEPSFLTLVLQDEIGGLQVLHKDQLVDVPPVNGAFVANLGDFVQLITNNKFNSVQHRVLATSHVKPRISVVSFFVPMNGDKRVRR
ncbi:putative deacetoxyvindoline 4-hydroxylase [Rosa chinensis]|uniref:Putative deacetoxyvindoline 4-hydroxylase n=1 Tax=Rosa chinensis TaxID=74649 RepID=A0A2P6PVE2_ROSCH|nr:putative deacetoxyvindoline 4-hydroxylase [Rosa chinensis]